MSSSLHVRLTTHLAATGLLDTPGLGLLAVSGGSDSVALVDLMATVAPRFDVTLAIAHVEHGIQPVTADVPALVTRLAERFGLPCHISCLDLGRHASETLARRERYRALRSVQEREGARYLVTAHHRDDQVETVVYRFLRGSGVAGLAGIPMRGPGGLVRPLLPFSRAELLEWLEYRYPDPNDRPGVFQDPANRDQSFDRVWIRHTLLPLVRERMGSELDDRVQAAAADAVLERNAWSAALRELAGLRVRVRVGSAEVDRAEVQRYDKALSLVLLRAVAREAGCLLGRRRAGELLAFSSRGVSGRALQLGGGWEAEVSFRDLTLRRRASRSDSEVSPATAEWGIGDSGSTTWGGWEFSWRLEEAQAPQRASLTTWVTPGRGEIREPRQGERILPLGGVGRRRVRRLLMESRVPARERCRYPVFTRDSEVVWIPGICRSAAALPRVGDLAVRLDARATRTA